jgi:quercetin dioxygenase-like cupin family protein
MVVTPYSETINGKIRTRTFDSSVDRQELMWHRDRQTRTVKIVEGTGWRFQMDNQLPQALTAGDVLYIPKETYHRVIAGDSKLVVEIEEHED